MNESIKKARAILRAVDNPVRERIMDYLRIKGEANVKTMEVDLDMTQSDVSQHLGVLRDVKMVTTRRDGQKTYYSLRTEHINKINELSEQIVKIKTGDS